MSFFSNFQSDKCPGVINGNALQGLCEKVCIQAEKVFDACIKQNQQESYTLTLTNITPSTVTYPLTFVSARSSSSSGTVSNLTVDREEGKCCSRVSATVTVPMQVAFIDASGVEGTADSSISLPVDVLLYVPSPSIMPYNITATVSAVAPEGTYVSENTFSVSCCTTLIAKVTMPVDMLVPTYGYCAIPPAQEYSQEVCAGFFELPLYPKGCACNRQ